ncbi:MAG: RNA polymerase sigma factor [Anaerolineae bacterium]|nr:RNA polymerase sigma factor [Anaerolineae bacterium]
MLDNDQTLIEQAKRDPQAFAWLYDRYVDRIYRYAYRQTGDEALAQDVTAVTFERALRHIQRYQWRGQSVLAWLYRIARNEAISQQRKRKWLTPWPLMGQTETRATETAVLHHQRHEALHHALTRLPAKDREIIALRFFEELSGEEVAEVLACSPNTMYVRLHRALKRLQSQLEAMGVTGEVNYGNF